MEANVDKKMRELPGEETSVRTEKSEDNDKI